MAVKMRNKILQICVLISLVSANPLKKSKHETEWEDNHCHFPPGNLYIEDGTSLRKCLNEELKNQTISALSLCKFFFQAVNNHTCKSKVFTGSISEILEKANADAIEQYCNGSLKSSFPKDCQKTCTKDRFSTEMCTLIYLANNITAAIRKYDATLLPKSSDEEFSILIMCNNRF